MTPAELKYNVSKGEDGHFFDRSSMKFFGDTMANYGVRSNVIDGVEVWELHRKRPVKHGLKNSAYFNKKTFARVFKREV